MAEARRKFDEDFKQGAERLVRETGKPIAQVAPPAAGWASNGRWAVPDRPSTTRSSRRGTTLTFELRALEHFATKAQARAQVPGLD